jgi:hypothetical protein
MIQWHHVKCLWDDTQIRNWTPQSHPPIFFNHWTKIHVTWIAYTRVWYVIYRYLNKHALIISVLIGTRFKSLRFKQQYVLLKTWATESTDSSNKTEMYCEQTLHSQIERGNVLHFTHHNAETSRTLQITMPKRPALYVSQCRNVLHVTYHNAETSCTLHITIPKRPALYISQRRNVPHFTSHTAETHYSSTHEFRFPYM